MARIPVAIPRSWASSALRASALLLPLIAAYPLMAQDDVTTRDSTRAYGGGSIAGPASTPISFLDNPEYKAAGETKLYDLPDLHPATLLNEKLPKWLGFGWEERARDEGYHDGGFKLNNNDSYLLLRTRVQMTIRPTRWLKLVSQLQDARPLLQKPPYGPPNLNAWDLKLGYVEVGDPEKHWISVRVGRQLINYNNTILANSEWRNQGRSYDAVATNFHYKRVRLGIFAASAVVPRADGVSSHQEGNNIYGAFGSVDRIVPNSELQPFVLWRIQPSVSIETNSKVKVGKQDEWAFGTRFKGLTLKHLDYTAEWIGERGSDGPNSINAWATDLGAGYRIDPLWSKPRLFYQYDYASGDKNPADGRHGTFDTMYPTAHDRFGITDQFGWQNIIAHRAGLTIEPRHRWSITGQFLDFRLASATDAVYNTSGGAIVRDKTGKSGTHLGHEFDGYTWYELNRHVYIGAGIGHIVGGQFLRETTKGPNYNYPYFAINFKDDGREHN